MSSQADLSLLGSHEGFYEVLYPGSKWNKFDTFLYRYFNHSCHAPNNISIQPVEKVIYELQVLVVDLKSPKYMNKCQNG